MKLSLYHKPILEWCVFSSHKEEVNECVATVTNLNKRGILLPKQNQREWQGIKKTITQVTKEDFMKQTGRFSTQYLACYY